MKETPIIFSTPMVKAILEGRKTQTRRIVKCIYEIVDLATPEEWNAGRAHPNMLKFEEWGPKRGSFLFRSDTGTVFGMPCPYGKAGDLLWVKETWQVGASGNGPAVVYRSIEDVEYPDWLGENEFPYEKYPAKAWEYGCWVWDVLSDSGPWNPSIFMPKWATRTWLEITDIGVERLQDISEEDCIAEGSQIPLGQLPKSCQQATMNERTQFSRIWDSINKKKHPWSSNPWVWKIEFKRVAHATHP